MDAVIAWVAGLPPILIYVVIGVGAAVENVVPPIPADTFVLLGGFIAESGRANAVIVFFVTWACNVAAALGVYALAWRYGAGFFQTRFGHFLLQPRQMQQIGRFYERWGVPAIFFSRFLPAFRALVPVFAGVTHVPLGRLLPPLAIASALWYGALVFIGAAAGRNWAEIMAVFERASGWLVIPGTILILLVVVWWWRTRGPEREEQAK